MLLLPAGQRGEAWELSKSNALSDVGEHWIENYFHLVFKVLLTIQEPARLRNGE
jgi:hypothetical protein